MTTVEVPESHLRENPFEIAREQLRRVAEIFAIDHATTIALAFSSCAAISAPNSSTLSMCRSYQTLWPAPSSTRARHSANAWSSLA